ncbi:MAG TPA: D-alanyl-D-alanine carboxypeptidase family protein [Gemmatimonadaceae bacterium]
MSSVVRSIAWLCGFALLACGGSGSDKRALVDSAEPAAATALPESSLIDSIVHRPGWWKPLLSVFGSEPDSVEDDEGDGEGHNSEGIPNYATREFSLEDSLILRRAYGIEDPHRLYVSDSTDNGVLLYDTEVKKCRRCIVNSYGVGFVSVRRWGESWEQVERRVKATRARWFTGAPHPMGYTTKELDPVIRAGVEQMLADAAKAGYKVRVIATYRSPQRQAYLMSLRGKERTHTLTSTHSYGRSVDVVIDDGNRARKKTKANWINFRIWLTKYRAPTGEMFHVLGAMDHTWDWPHVEVTTAKIGFRSIDEALERGRACLAPGSTTPCDFAPNLPTHLQP